MGTLSGWGLPRVGAPEGGGCEGQSRAMADAVRLTEVRQTLRGPGEFHQEPGENNKGGGGGMLSIQGLSSSLVQTAMKCCRASKWGSSYTMAGLCCRKTSFCDLRSHF